MRPKKRILLIDADQDRRSVFNFILTTHAYAVFPASNAAEVLSAVKEFALDAAVIAWAPLESKKILLLLRKHSPYTRTLVVAEGVALRPLDAVADMVLWGRPLMCDFLEKLALVAGRKRGPKKIPPVPMPGYQPAVQAQNYSWAGTASVAMRRIA